MSAADCLEQMVAAVAGEDSRRRTRSASSNCSTRRATTMPPTRFVSLRSKRRWRPQRPPESPPAPGTPARGEAKATTRVPTELLDNLVRMVGELTIKIGELDQELKSASGHSRELIERDRAIQKRLLRTRTFRRHPRRRRAPQVERGRTRASDFDSLEMDQYNEVQSLTRALIEETTDARDLGVGLKDELAGLAGILHQQQRLMRELQHLTSQTRMAPVETIVPRLQRNVRQTAAATHKQASARRRRRRHPRRRRRAEPADRPAAAHPAQRGRPRPRNSRRARSARQAARRHHHADRGAPRPGGHRAGRRRWPRPQSRATSEQGDGTRTDRPPTPAEDAEIARLTLLPGFSTRDAVTEISGRGVGLDVVATRLRALSGSIDIRSEAGRGLTIELRFQASLVATHALFVRDGGQVFGIASHAVRRAVPAVAVKLERERRRVVRARRRHRYPAHELAMLTGMRPPTAPNAAISCWSTANPAPSACSSMRCSKPTNS